MHIAFTSFEFPPDTGAGGIGTYTLQIARMFSERGIRVTVVCSSPVNEGMQQLSPLLTVHKIRCADLHDFKFLLPKKLKTIYEQDRFDIIETPEYASEALFIKDCIPGVPLVIKLHSPSFLLKRLNDYYYDKTLLRSFLLLFKKKYNYKLDKEYQALLNADYIISPSHSLKEIISNNWHIDKEAILHAPNPYIASAGFLNIPVSSPGKTVLFLGRLECRKGAYELGKIMPATIALDPEIKFIIVGKELKGPYRRKRMKQTLQDMCRGFENNIEFIDSVPLEQVPFMLQKADLCIFPSIWENFPNVCLEAMSAGKAVIASKEGGMSEMIENNAGGVLVDPFATEAVAQTIVTLIKDKPLLEKMGHINRQKVINYYNDELVTDLILMYENFIKNFSAKSKKTSLMPAIN